MAYAQTSYPQVQGINGRYSIHDIGCLLTAFCNLRSLRYGRAVDPLMLNAFFTAHGVYVDVDDGVRDDLGWTSITSFDSQIKISRVVDRGTSQTAGLPSSNQAILKFYYYSPRLGRFTTHFVLYDGDGWIIDSWDGVRKHIASTDYGNPVAFAEFTSVAAPAPAPAPAPVAVPSGNAVVLPKTVPTWAVYNRGSGLRKGTADQKGTLLPAKYGPLVYHIEGWVGNYAVNITTQDFGPVTIWVKDTDAQIINAPTAAPVAPPAPAPVPAPAPTPAPPAAPVPLVKAEKYTLVAPVMAFSSPAAAKDHNGVADTLEAGDYYIWAKDGIAYNLTTDNMKDRSQWVNTLDNKVPEPAAPKVTEPPKAVDITPPPVIESPVSEPSPQVPAFKIVNHYLKMEGSTPVAVKFEAINQVPVTVKDFTSGKEAVLAEYNKINGVSHLVPVIGWFTGPDNVKYYMPEQVYRQGKGFGIRADLLREVKKRGPLDFNGDGRIDLDDITTLGGFIMTESKRGYGVIKDIIDTEHKLNITDKTMSTYHGVKQKVIDGIQFRGKVKK